MIDAKSTHFEMHNRATACSPKLLTTNQPSITPAIAIMLIQHTLMCACDFLIE